MFATIPLPRVKTSIKAMRLLGDRLLVRVEEQPEKMGSLIIPETARRPGADGSSMFLRYGVVVLAGPGDRCGAPEWKAAPDYETNGSLIQTGVDACPGAGCELCNGTGRLPMHVKVGDRILYDHPSDKAFLIEGAEHVFIHEEQHLRAAVSNG